MRVSLIFTLLASVIGLTLGQSCTTNPTCPTTVAATVPSPWFALNFTTDPRNNSGVTNALYGWQQQDSNADGCAAYHQGLLTLPGASFTTYTIANAPFVNLSTATGPQSVGVALPASNIGGVGSGSYALATSGWSFEVTFKTPSYANWAKVYDLGLRKPSLTTGDNRDCDGDIILGWNSGGPVMNFQTCVNGGSNTIGNNPANLTLNTWHHIVAVLQQSPDQRSTYTVYVDGAITSVTTQQQTILNQFRDQASLGRSTWNDAYFIGSYDTFNIYDVALTPAQVTALFNAEMGGCAITRAANVAPTLPTTVPQELFSADFANNVSSSTSLFGWVAQDAADVACGINTRHTGLLTLDGTGTYRPLTGPYVNLSATSGPNYAGVTMPTFGGVTTGAGSLATLSAGFSVEVTFKPWFQNYGGKIYNFGNTNSATGTCSAGDFWLGWASEQLSLQLYVCTGTNTFSVFNPLGAGSAPIGLQTWNHVVISFISQSNNLATVAAYINGNLTAIAQNVYMPGFIQRQHGNLGRSNFVGGDDTYWSGEIDTVKIYNQALNQQQVLQLTGLALYGSASARSGTSTCPQAANTATTVPASSVFYSALFGTDPRSFAGGASSANYGWLQYDTNDTLASQQQHDGLIVLGYGRGASNPGRYVNLSSPASSSSVGQPLQQFGGFGSGSYNAGTAGWSFEIEFRALETQSSTATVNGQTWAKVMDFGNGNTGSGCYNDLVLGFSSDSRTMNFQTCAVQGNQQTVGATPLFINWGSWYHVLVVLQLVPGGSLGSVYANGTLVAQSTIPYFPLFAPRNNAQIGKSSWADAYFNGEVDMFNIYSQALNAAQAQALYAASLLPPPSSSTGVAASSSSSGAAAVASSSSSSSGSVIPPPVGGNSTSSSSSTGVSSARSSSSSTSTVPAAASSVSSSSSSSNTGSIFVSPTSSAGAVSSTGSVAGDASSSSSTGSTPAGPNSASMTGVPSMMILSIIVIFVSLMF